MRKNIIATIVLTLFVASFLLLSTKVSADGDEIIDHVELTVPVACTMSSTGNTSHNATVKNGLYEDDIGSTELHIVCNDHEGFAVYAAGYTGNEVGGINSDKLVGTSASNNAIIESGLATSAGNPDVSNWAMKLAITQDSGDTTGTNAFAIDSAPNVALPSQAGQSATLAPFSQYHVIPNEYTKVAHKNSSTDMADVVGGVNLTTTYAAYIRKTQPADIYSGQVIYTLVHPASHAAPGTGIQVTYNGGDLQFTSGATTNRVDYIVDRETAYLGNEFVTSKTPNVNSDGTASSGYAHNVAQANPVTINGADKLKVVIDYGLEETYDFLYVFEGAYSGEVMGGPMEAGQVATFTGGEGSDETQFVSGRSATLYIDGDTVTFAFFSDDYEDGGFYGYYAKIYPVYTTEQADTTLVNLYSISDVVGAYVEPNHFKGTWTMGANTFADEEEIKAYISEHAEEIASTGLTVTAANPYAIVYDGNTASAGTMNGFITIPDPANPNDASGVNNTVDLMAPNFKKTGYGFAGWSENPNAVVNGSDTIYGPNQNINAGTLTYDEDNNKSAVLYAVWVQSSGNMQDFECNMINDDQVIALTDTRDNNVYAVGKLADGDCWMMENLRLDNAATLSSSNTNNPASGFTSIAASTDNWCTDENETCINQNKLNANNTNLGGTNSSNIPLINGPGQYNGSNDVGGTKGGDGDNYSWYSYGNYYNWYTATAGTGTYSLSSSEATGSICPSGWILPIGYHNVSSVGQFSVLDIEMNGTGGVQSDSVASNRWRTYPVNFVYSGAWWGPAAGRRGSNGYYWSSTAENSNNAKHLYLGDELIVPAYNGLEKYFGLPMRCVNTGLMD